MKKKNTEILYDVLDVGKDGSINTQQIVSGLESRGISLSDPRLSKASKVLKAKGVLETISKKEFVDIFSDEIAFFERVVKNDLTIPDFSSFKNTVEKIFHKVKKNSDGNLATYIPQLARVDPDKFAVSICTIDGQVLHLGDSEDMFCIQSSCKPINYCLAVEGMGLDKVHQHVGHEPSGRSFNELSLNNKGLPHNPLINSGAIMCASLIRPEASTADRFDHVLSTWKKCCNNENVAFNNAVYLSERETADRNFALAYFMRENGAFPEGTDIHKTLEFYFQCCSIETNSENIATLAASLASGGICPFTGRKNFGASTIKNCLSLMNSCGMYDYSGQFSFHIGLPAKSGVSGVVYAVVPNTMGICIWSPRLDALGNSVRAVEFCKELTNNFLFHSYDSLVTEDTKKKNPRLNEEQYNSYMTQELCLASAHGDISYIQSLIAKGCDINQGDYDLRTPLHLAVCERKYEAVRYLTLRGAKIDAKDRWGNSPLDEAKKLKDKKLIMSLDVRKLPYESIKSEVSQDILNNKAHPQPTSV